MPKKMTKEEFIAKAEARYGKGKYNFDEVDYQGNKIKVKIFCNKCQTYFWKRPNDFLSGSECKCQNELYKNYHNKETFIQKAIEVYGPDKYSFDEVDYINSKTPVKIHCNSCGKDFYKSPIHFLEGCECPCKSEITTELFISRAKILYGEDRYGFNQSVYINNKTPVKIYCPECDSYFYKTPHAFIDGNLGCPICSLIGNESNGEKLIRKILNGLNLDFNQEFLVKDLIHGRNTDLVKIDFELNLKEKEIWIEYNGEQHYIEINFFNNSDPDWYKKQLQRDKNVRDYCKENGIILIEIPYTYKRYDILKPILEDIIFNGKSPEDLIVSPEIENYKEYLGLD